MDPNSSSFIRFQCILHNSGVIFSKSWNFSKLRKVDLFLLGPNFPKTLNYLVSPFCISVLKVLSTQFLCHSLVFNSAWFRSTFLRVLKYLQIKEGGPNFWGEPILQKVWIISPPLLYFNIKSFTDPNSPSFIRFQCILYDSVVLFSGSWNFYKLKKGVLISRGNQFCRKSALFGAPFCISILKVLRTQILRHSLDFNAFCMIQ